MRERADHTEGEATRMAAKGKQGRKKTNSKKMRKPDGEWCFPECTLNRNHQDNMIQCHLCQVWVHYECIDEKEDDIVGIWCCNICRKLSYNMSLLCNKINDIQRDMATLINYATSLDNSNRQHINNNKVCDGKPDVSNNLSLIVRGQNPINILRDLLSTEHEHNNKPCVNVNTIHVPDQNNIHADESSDGNTLAATTETLSNAKTLDKSIQTGGKENSI